MKKASLLLSALVVIILLLSITGCVNKQQAKIPVYSISEAEEASDISDYIKEIVFIPINDSLPFGVVSKALLTQRGDLLLLDATGQVLLFEENCSKVRQPVMKGRASNEYVSASDIAIRGDTLIILDNQTIHYFPVYNRGKHKSFILDLKSPGDAIAPFGKSGVYVFSSFAPKFHDNRKTGDPLLFAIDDTGRIVEEFIDREDCTFSLFNITQSSGNKYFLRPQNNENIFYCLGEDGIYPSLKIDFGQKNIPARFFYNKASEDISVYMSSDYYKIPLDLYQTENHVYFRCAGRGGDDVSFVFDRNTHKGFRWTTSPNDGDIRFLASDDSSFFMIFNCMVDNEKNHGPMFKAISSFAEQLHIESSKTYLLKIYIHKTF